MNVTALEKAFVGRSYAYASILIPSWLLASHDLKHTLVVTKILGPPKNAWDPNLAEHAGPRTQIEKS